MFVLACILCELQIPGKVCLESHQSPPAGIPQASAVQDNPPTNPTQNNVTWEVVSEPPTEQTTVQEGLPPLVCRRSDAVPGSSRPFKRDGSGELALASSHASKGVPSDHHDDKDEVDEKEPEIASSQETVSDTPAPSGELALASSHASKGVPSGHHDDTDEVDEKEPEIASSQETVSDTPAATPRKRLSGAVSGFLSQAKQTVANHLLSKRAHTAEASTGNAMDGSSAAATEGTLSRIDKPSQQHVVCEESSGPARPVSAPHGSVSKSSAPPSHHG